jgi:uncharacterized protein
MKVKGIDLGFKDADTKQGIVSGYFAMFGNKDLDGDIIEQGAFSKTIKERGPQGKKLIKYLLDHDKTKAVARIDELYEDEKGLAYVAQIGSHSLGVDFAKMVDSGIINQHSFGFSVPKDKQFFDKSRNANIIKEVMLYEGSAIQFLGANPDTNFIEMKSEKDAIEYIDLLEKFIRTSDATDETLQNLEIKLNSLLELMKPSPDTSKIKEAEQINSLFKTLENSWKI